MIDLSFLTEVEKEAILKVLNRDSELKKAEEQRIRHLQDEVNDENELKYKSGQWFYEAKSRRHRDKIHGADLVRASIRKRKNPATIAELSQSSKDKSQRRWVNSVNQDLFIPPELYGVMEPPDEAEEDLLPNNVKSIQSARTMNLNAPDIGKDIMKNGTASPAKQRKNPFNSEGGVDETDLHNDPKPGLVNGQVGRKSGTEPLYAVVKKPPKPTSPDQDKDKKPDTPSEKSNSKKGKPALAGSTSDSNSSKHDKYTLEGMKAQDESISKVLDWFSRRSDSFDDQLPSVGLLERSKNSPQQIIYGGKLEDDAFEPEDNANEASLKIKSIPKISGISDSTEDRKTIDPDQPSPQKISTYTDKMEDDASEPQVNENEYSQIIKSIPQMAGTSEPKEDPKTIAPDQPSTQQVATYTAKMEEASEPQVNENEHSEKINSIAKMAGVSESKEDLKTIAPDQQITTYMDKMEDASQPQVNENEDSQKIKTIPQMADTSESKEDLNAIDLDQPVIQNMTNSSPMECEVITPQKVTLTEFLEFGKTGSGCGKIQGSPINNDDFSQNYPELYENEILQKNRDPDQNMTTFIPIEDAVFPIQQSPITEFLAFGKSGSGCGKLQSSSTDDQASKTDLELAVGEEFEKDKESLENEKERKVLKEKIASLDVEDAGETPVKKMDQSEAVTSNLRKNEDTSSEKSENAKSIAQQKKVSDIKLLWEGGRSSQDATKQPVLSSTKRMFSPVELSVTPKSSSLDSDDQNAATSLVAFKKVLVEDEEDPMYPVDELKSFWENEKNKDTKHKQNRESTMTNESWSVDKSATLEDPKSKFKKWHTIHNFFNEEKSTDLMKKVPGRSVSLGESANESLKSASFQNLKNFWSTSRKSDNKGTDKAVPENTKNQFGSNPDLRSKESFVARAKGRLAAKSLQDIREDPSAAPQYRVYDAEPLTRKYIKGNGKNEYARNAVDGIKTEKYSSGGNDKLGEPISSINVMAQESLLPSNHSKTTGTIPDNCEAKQGPGISDEQMALTDNVEKSVDPKNVQKSELSLKLKTTPDEVPGTGLNLPDEGSQSIILENYLEDPNVYRDEENGEINEKGRKMLLIKQNGFDSSLTAFSNVSGSPQQNEESFSEKEPIKNEETSESREVVNENIEKTSNLLKNDFDRKLQNLNNESLNLDGSQIGDLTEPEYMDMNEPDENFSKVLAISSGSLDKNIHRSGEESHQPIIVNISSKKTEIGNEDLSNVPPDSPTDTSLIKSPHSADVPTVLGDLEQPIEISPSEAKNETSEEPTSNLKGSLARDPDIVAFSSEPNDCNVATPQPEKLSRKEIIERIEMPVILPRTHFNYFDEKLKQLYEESQNSEPNLKETTDCDDVAEKNENIGKQNKANVYLYSSEPKKTFLESSSSVNLESSQTPLSDRETLTDESAPYGSQAPDILVQEVNETIEKTVAPTRISAGKGLEKLQKEALNEEEGGFVGNVTTSGHLALNESHSKLSDQALGKNGVSETFPRDKGAVLEGTEAARYEDHQEDPSETSVAFMSNKQSTPVKDKNSSLRRSTLELYLETPYRRENSKSIDFDISGYVTSEVNKCRFDVA